MAFAIYARKSTESEERQVQSLDDQLSALEDLALQEGIEIKECIIESKSAKEPGARPEFSRLIRLIESGEIDGILTWSINRLSRNLVEGGNIAHLLQTGKLKSIRTPGRTYLPEDNVLVIAVENGMATGYIQDLSRNVRRGMKGKAERGWRPGVAPLGYFNNTSTHEIEPHPVHFALVRHAWDLLLSGNYTLIEIHSQLIKLGLKGARGSDANKPVCRNVFYRLFSNQFYAGTFTYDGRVFEGKHKAVISQNEFDQAQVILGRATNRRKRTHEHLFSGVFFCRNCGCQNIGETKRKTYSRTSRQVTYTYYHCSGMKGCPKISMKEEDIFHAGKAIVDSIAISPEFSSWAKSALQHQAERDMRKLEGTVSQLNSRIWELSERLKRARIKAVDEVLTPEDYQALKSEINLEIESLTSLRADMEGEADFVTSYVTQQLDIAERATGFSLLEKAAKRGLFRALGQKHYLTLGKLEFEVNPILQKIASCERVRDSSQTPQSGDFSSNNLQWLGLINDMRNIAREEIKRESLSP